MSTQYNVNLTSQELAIIAAARGTEVDLIEYTAVLGECLDNQVSEEEPEIDKEAIYDILIGKSRKYLGYYSEFLKSDELNYDEYWREIIEKQGVWNDMLSIEHLGFGSEISYRWCNQFIRETMDFLLNSTEDSSQFRVDYMNDLEDEMCNNQLSKPEDNITKEEEKQKKFETKVADVREAIEDIALAHLCTFCSIYPTPSDHPTQKAFRNTTLYASDILDDIITLREDNDFLDGLSNDWVGEAVLDTLTCTHRNLSKPLGEVADFQQCVLDQLNESYK